MGLVVQVPESTDFVAAINRFELYLESKGIIKTDADGKRYIDIEAEAVKR